MSTEALLKTCYWFSRDFVCDVQSDGGDHVVCLKAKGDAGDSLDGHAKSALLLVPWIFPYVNV